MDLCSEFCLFSLLQHLGFLIEGLLLNNYSAFWLLIVADFYVHFLAPECKISRVLRIMPFGVCLEV